MDYCSVWQEVLWSVMLDQTKGRTKSLRHYAGTANLHESSVFSLAHRFWACVRSIFTYNDSNLLK